MNYLIYTLQFVTYAPWVVMYLSLAVPSMGALRNRDSSPSSYVGALADGIGQTFCVIWLVVAPFLLFALALILGLFGSLGITISGACFGLAGWLQEEKKYSFASVALIYAFGAVAFFVGIALAMPYSELALRLPLELQPWSGANRTS